MNKNMRGTRFVLSCSWGVYFFGWLSVCEDEASSTSEDIWLHSEMLYRPDAAITEPLAVYELHVATQ